VADPQNFSAFAVNYVDHVRQSSDGAEPAQEPAAWADFDMSGVAGVNQPVIRKSECGHWQTESRRDLNGKVLTLKFT
jgi:hypothetical protein